MYVQPELQFPEIGVLALVAESNDVARVAASLNIPCAAVRGIAAAGARTMLVRYHAAKQSDEAFILPDNYAALIQSVKLAVRSDVVHAVSILTERERLEVFESLAYFRAFCNSPVQNLGVKHGKV